MQNYLALFVFFFTFSGCSQESFSYEIPAINVFNQLKGKSLNTKFSNTESLKVVYDVKNRNIYFLNSNKYTFHNEFCTKILGYRKGLQTFNQESYNNKPYRKFLLGNIIHVSNSDVWALELAASDLMQPKFIEELFLAIRKNVFFGKDLKFYLNTQRLMNLDKKELSNIPCVKADYIFQNLQEQSIEKGETIGILKKYDLKNGDKLEPNENEIILINAIPDFLPKVKGIIITELLTPLSHLVILAKNRNIPLYADKKAWQKSNLNNLIGKKVKFTVKKDNYLIKKTNSKIRSKKNKTIYLKKNSSRRGIVNLNNNSKENYNQVKAIGSKAQNLFYLKMLEKSYGTYRTPEHCYAIPFYYYEEHISKNGIKKEILKLMKISKDSVSLINNQLKNIQELIKSHEVNPNLIGGLKKILNSQNEYRKFRFRSSTNSEDIEGFNGAGLYDSKSAVLGDSIKTIEKAIKTVWASVWNERAFWERSIFNINQRSVSMAILIHRSFPDELANGVLISKNLYRKYKGITVNVQKGENSVVEPKHGEICDEFYVYNLSSFNPYNLNSEKKNLSIDYRSVSNLNDGQPILNNNEISILFSTLPKLEGSINRLWEKYHKATTSYTLDIEFKIEGENRQLYFKQVRPYLE